MRPAPLYLTVLACLLAAAGWVFSALLYINTRDHTEDLRTFAVAGCERQNALRNELNVVLHSFGQPPRFDLVDCPAEYERKRN